LGSPLGWLRTSPIANRTALRLRVSSSRIEVRGDARHSRQGIQRREFWNRHFAHRQPIRRCLLS
jgi:hypothetical protein